MFRWKGGKGRAACAPEATSQKAGCLLDLAFLEGDMLAQHRIVLLDREFLGHGAGVLLGDIEEAAAALAVEADLRGGGLRHGMLQLGRGGGRWLTLPVLSRTYGQAFGFPRFLPRKRVLSGRFPDRPGGALRPGWEVPAEPSANSNLNPPVRGAASISLTRSASPIW